LKLTKKHNQNKFIFGYDSRTGLNGVLEGFDKLCNADNNEDKKIIEVVPHNIIPSIEQTINDFSFFKKTILEKGNTYNCEIHFSDKWNKYNDEEEIVKEEKIIDKIKSSSDIFKKQLLRKKPILINEKKEEPKNIENNILSIKKVKSEDKPLVINNDLSSFNKNVRCGFEENISSNSLVNKQINKSGKLLIENSTCVITTNNLGIIEANNSILILKRNVEKGMIIFNGENLSEQLKKENSYVVFSQNNTTIVEKL